ncbi:BHLH domain-containing protein [[Candida] zeylanoides]|jgi:hypothetical protein
MGDVFEHRKALSISSISSDESTRDLIESLGSDAKIRGRQETLIALEANDRTFEPSNPASSEHDIDTTTVIPSEPIALPAADSPVVALAIAKLSQVNANNSKKPIKFTVRKVSHDFVTSPEPNHPTSRNVSGHRSTSDANGSPTAESIAAAQLQRNVAQSQHKYDQYSKKIEKIEKEIDFLRNLLPPFNVEIDYATRNKISNAVEKLKMKQDELEKKKYSLGISISRLWRSMDDNEIWVRSMGKQ